jgi:hypothetical protein
VKHFLWHCTKEEQRKETMDLSKREIRQRFIDAGFVLVGREKPGP